MSRPLQSRRGFLLALAAGGAAGCRNPDVARVILEGPEGSGIMGSKLFAVLAVSQASAAQQREAEEAARAAERRIVAAARAKAAAPKPPAVAAPAPAPEPEPAPIPLPPPEPTAAERKTLPPVLAVKVTEEKKQGAAAVMLWDTRTASLADANVYDLKKEPPTGRRLTWKTSVASLQAVYVGTDWPN